MNEQELRSLVRAAVARHLGTGAPSMAAVESRAASSHDSQEPVPLRVFSSHTLYAGLVNVGDACVIEPAVKCDHCGFCKSHGY
jgi:hypothetical protein